jgi:shikimate kinase
VLTGFMTSGKSTVGRRLAARLGWRFVDLDREIERATGLTISEIFRDSGEAEFRRMEAEATEALRPFDRLVLAPGGGWITGPAADAAFDPGVLLVWLRVGLEEVLRRAARRPGIRPLLDGPDPRAAAQELLRAREPYYQRAHLIVDSHRSPPRRVVARIMAAIRAAEPGPADDGGVPS